MLNNLLSLLRNTLIKKFNDVLNVFKSANRAKLNFLIHCSLDTKYRFFLKSAKLGDFSGIVKFNKLDNLTYKADTDNLSFSEIFNLCHRDESLIFEDYRQ